VVAYELLTGYRPFEDTSPSAEASAHIRDTVRPASLGSDLPPAIDAVFERALAKDPAARYGSARELVDALEEALAADDQPTRVLAAMAAPPQGPTRKRRAWLTPAIVALRLLAAGAIARPVLGTRAGHEH